MTVTTTGAVNLGGTTILVDVDPKATYLRTEQDPQAVDVVPLDLAALGIAAGDPLYFITLAQNRYDDLLSYSWDMAYLFSSSTILLASTSLNRVPGALLAQSYAINNSLIGVTPHTLIGSFATDVGQDFVGQAGVVVPVGATHLFYSLVDNFFSSNADGFEQAKFIIERPSIIGFASAGTATISGGIETLAPRSFVGMGAGVAAHLNIENGAQVQVGGGPLPNNYGNEFAILSVGADGATGAIRLTGNSELILGSATSPSALQVSDGSSIYVEEGSLVSVGDIELAGTLRGSGTIDGWIVNYSGGVSAIKPGTEAENSIGTLAVSGQIRGGNVHLDIASTAGAGIGHDQISAELAQFQSITVNALPSYTVTPGDRFVMVDTTTIPVDDMTPPYVFSMPGYSFAYGYHFDGSDGTDLILDVLGVAGASAILDFDETSTQGAVVETTLGVYEAHGGKFGDAKVVFSGVTEVVGTAVDDVLALVGTNAVKVTGGSGNDTIAGGSAGDILDGGAGSDTVNYSSSGGVNVKLGPAGFTLGSHAQGDTLINVENIIGSYGNDVLEGDDGDNVLDGYSGVDTLIGGGGNDSLTASAGSADGGTGTDRWLGAYNADFSNDITADGNAQGVIDSVAVQNIEIIDGNAHSWDLFKVGADSLTFDGNGGSDTLVLNQAQSGYTVSFNGSTGALVLSSATATFSAFDIENFVFGNMVVTDLDLIGTTTREGTAVGDVIFGDAGFNVMNGLDGNDVFVGSDRADQMNGGDGIDTAFYWYETKRLSIDLSSGIGGNGFHYAAEEGDTYISIENALSGSGDDTLIGNADANFFNSRAGDDWLDGGAGGDALHGGDGDDYLLPGAGSDYVVGGEGHDTLSYEYSNEGVAVFLNLGGGSTGDALGDGYVGIENVIGTQFDDTLVGDEGQNTLEAGSGDDVLVGGQGADKLFGDGGYDTVSYIDSPGNVQIDLESASNDAVRAGGSLNSDARGDILYEIENIIGSNYDDILIGNYDSNFLSGAGGDDWLSGHESNDSLFGGLGADMFVFESSYVGYDYIGDFEDGVDRFYLDADFADEFSDLSLLQILPSRYFITVNGFTDAGITVNAQSAITLTADDFVFGFYSAP
jgi:Ca2+-binding RTX toxin-like protein